MTDPQTKDPIQEVKEIWKQGDYDTALRQLEEIGRKGEEEKSEASLLLADLKYLVDLVNRGYTALREGERDEGYNWLEEARAVVDSLEEWPYPPLDELEQALEEQPEVSPPPPEDYETQDDEIERTRKRVLRRLSGDDLPIEEEYRLLKEAAALGITDADGQSIRDHLGEAMKRLQGWYEAKVKSELDDGKKYEDKGDYAKAKRSYARAQAILEERPGQPKEGVGKQWYNEICRNVERMDRAIELNKELPKHREAIGELIQDHEYRQAIQKCDEILAVVQDPTIEALRQQAEARLGQQQVIDNVLAEAEQALNEGDHARAITILEQATKRYPESEPIKQALKDARTAQQQAQEKIKSLLQEADEVMSKLDFAQALEKYEAVLALDKDSEDAYFGRSQAREYDELLQNIDTKIKQAHTELDRHAWGSAQALYQEASELDTDGWRKTELKRLKRALDKAEKSLGAYRTTLDERLEKGEVRWPDEMEEFAEEFRQASPGLAEFEVLTQIGKRQDLFLQQHFNFLSAELSEIEKLALAGDLKECVARLRQIKHRWEPILSDDVRLAAWPNTEPLFRAVESRIGGAFELLDSYESAARRAEDVDQTIQFAREVLSKPDGHYEAAIQRIQKHLYEGLAEDDPAYDILRSYYASLEQLKTDLQYAWDVQRSRKVIYLNQAEGLILLEEYEQAQAALGNVLPEDLTSDDQERWEELNQAVQLGIAVTGWMQKADEAWDTGDWETAQTNYQSIAGNPHVTQESRYRQKAESRLKGLEDVLYLDGQVQNALAKPTYTWKEVKEIDEILSRIHTLGLLSSNYLKRQAEALQQRRGAWHDRVMLRRRARVALSQGRWEAAEEILEGLEDNLDPEVIKLQKQLDNVKRASDRLEKANELLEHGYTADDLREAIRYLRRALTVFKSVDKLKLETKIGYEVRGAVDDLTEALEELKQAQGHERTARSAAGQNNYELAYQEMAQAYLMASSHRIIREQFEEERDKFKKLLHYQKPFHEQLRRAETLVEAGDLEGAVSALNRAQDYLDKAPLGEEVDRLYEVETSLVNQLLDRLDAAWRAAELKEVNSRLNWFDKEVQPLLEPRLDRWQAVVGEIEDYRRRYNRHLALAAFKELLREAKLAEADSRLLEIRQLSDSTRSREQEELQRWDACLEAAKRVQEVNRTLENPNASSSELEETCESLRAVKDDYWPNPERLDETLCLLDYRLAVARAKEQEQEGNYLEAVAEYERAIESGLASQEDREEHNRISTTLELHQQALQAFEKERDFETAVNQLRMVPDRSQTWPLITELRARVLNKLAEQGDAEKDDKNYGRALQCYDLIRQLNNDGQKYQGLYRELQTRLTNFRDQFAQSVRNLNADPAELNDLVIELGYVYDHWGLDGSEVDWIPGARRDLEECKVNIEEADEQVERAQVKLDLAMEDGNLNAVYEELAKVPTSLKRRDSVREMYIQTERLTMAHKAIEEVFTEYEQSAHDLAANSKLIDAIAAYDPDCKFRITKDAWNMLTE